MLHHNRRKADRDQDADGCLLWALLRSLQVRPASRLQQLSASTEQSISCNCELPATKSKCLIETKAVPALSPNLFMWHHWETFSHYIEIQPFYKINYLTTRLLLFYVRSVKARFSSSPQSLWFYFLISCCLSFPLPRPIANDFSFSRRQGTLSSVIRAGRMDTFPCLGASKAPQLPAQVIDRSQTGELAAKAL